MAKAEPTDDFDNLVKLSYFTEIGKAITSARSLKEVLSEVMNQIGEVFAPSYWSLLLVDTGTGDLVFKIVIGKNADKLQGMKVLKGEGIAGWIAEHGQSVVIDDVAIDSRFSERIDATTGFKTKSIIGVPLKTQKRVFGVIELINKINGETFTPFDLKLLSTIADFAAIAIEKAYFFQSYRRMATIDSLTGVYNRRYFERMLSRETESAERYKYPVSCLLADVDNFKRINDKFGHLAGDRVLKRTADLLLANVRKADTVARFGGDEFVILMPYATREKSEIVRDRILQACEAANTDPKTLPFTLSIGLHSAGPETVSDLLTQTDMDLYREKDKRGDRELQILDRAFQDFLESEIDE